ncbi:hypothetical protein CP_0332 [Chlamydia pneumoniae AR39]|uniref:Uncharacterized protein n=1 Tax=Chlamydia pneumoniae TaxID=83558 RepID=Q9K295_CHLPN|nr:hypothetical protein CP_0332 [Chlamydia pneumoniae AR39]
MASNKDKDTGFHRKKKAFPYLKFSLVRHSKFFDRGELFS